MPMRSPPSAEEGGDRIGMIGHEDGEFDRVEHADELSTLLGALPERERAIVCLRFFRGLTQSEIAERIGISQMHVSRLLARSLDQLRREAQVSVGAGK